MTPEEAIKIAIHCFGVQAEQEVCEECPVYLESGIACREVARVAISALKEIQQYREIGTLEELKNVDIVLIKRNKTLERMIDECMEYERIGTLEECREAVEKQKPKKIIIRDWNPTKCPTCGHELSTSLGDGYYKHPTFLKRCPECGQAIQWDENLENEE